MAEVVTSASANILRGLKDETELWAVIAAMEHAAYESYRRLALLMARQGNDELEKLFRDIAEEERRQEQEAASRMDSCGSSLDIARLAAELGVESVTVDELEEAGGARALTPHGALSLAIKNEERAFILFNDIIVVCVDAGLRELSRRIAKEERAHLVRLRLARQRLYRPATAPAPVSEPLASVSIAEATALRAWATASILRELAIVVTGTDRDAVTTFLETLADQIDLPDQLGNHANAPMVPRSMSARQALLRALAHIEEDFGFFSDLLDAGLDPVDERIALGHAEATVERMALVRRWLNL
jgi:rubrerythrin